MDGMMADVDWRAVRIAEFPQGIVRIYELQDGRVRVEADNADLIERAVEWLKK